jgi:membrane-bound lytic murein transglycosylase D
MEPSSLRNLLTLLCALFFLQSQVNASFNPSEVKSRLETMECIVKPRYSSTVEGYVKKYLSYDGALAKRVMGRASMYFPIFEKYLSEHNLPKDLKFLAIVESALNPKAVSPAGAGGLWQFMAETGRVYGLTINKEVDERSCPHNSTYAAMRYLAKQFERFGSWELALAAYNCGAGTINNAAKRARTNNYWSLSRYLPRETRNFVPAFLGVAYIANYYQLHGVEPEYPGMDFQLTDVTKVYMKMEFQTIAAVTGLPVEMVAELNPAFKKDYIPENPAGFHLVLPKRVMQSFKDYLKSLNPEQQNGSGPTDIALTDPPALEEYQPDNKYFVSFYTVAEGDDLVELAKSFGCAAYNLKVWNSLTTNQLEKGQELQVWFPKEFHRFPARNEKIEPLPGDISKGISPTGSTSTIEKAPATPKIIRIQEIKTMPVKPVKGKISTPVLPHRGKETGFIYYQLHRNESLLDVAGQFPGVTVQNILEWNGLTMNHTPLPGTNLKIKTKG